VLCVCVYLWGAVMPKGCRWLQRLHVMPPCVPHATFVVPPLMERMPARQKSLQQQLQARTSEPAAHNALSMGMTQSASSTLAKLLEQASQKPSIMVPSLSSSLLKPQGGLGAGAAPAVAASLGLNAAPRVTSSAGDPAKVADDPLPTARLLSSAGVQQLLAHWQEGKLGKAEVGRLATALCGAREGAAVPAGEARPARGMSSLGLDLPQGLAGGSFAQQHKSALLPLQTTSLLNLDSTEAPFAGSELGTLLCSAAMGEPQPMPGVSATADMPEALDRGKLVEDNVLDTLQQQQQQLQRLLLQLKNRDAGHQERAPLSPSIPAWRVPSATNIRCASAAPVRSSSGEGISLCAHV
jgi:hypothetical protein